jgi:hypothetical protein
MPDPVILALGLPVAAGAGLAFGVAERLLRSVDVPGAARYWAHVVTHRGPIQLEDMQDEIEQSSRAWIDIVIRTSDACGLDRDEAAKFWGRVHVTAGCWYWTGPIGRTTGYGLHGSKGRNQSAHRWAYQFAHGKIPEGLHIDHVCHTRDRDCRGGRTCMHRRCVNPMHLEPVTPAENQLRAALHASASNKRLQRLQRRNRTSAWRWQLRL